jgi:hypothetical protein
VSGEVGRWPVKWQPVVLHQSVGYRDEARGGHLMRGK